MTGSTASLQAQGINRSFGGVRALSNVDLTVMPGEIHAVCGENGAGKSTLMGILAGSLAADAGEMWIEGERYRPTSPGHARSQGVAIVYQERSLMGNVSVAENICMTLPLAGGRVFLDRRAMLATSARLLADLDTSIDPGSPLGSYGVGKQQVVEIAKALARDPRILILDEPTASIDADARTHLFGILRMLRLRGLAIIYISHHLDEVFEVADRVTVLRSGRLVGTWSVEEMTEQRLVHEMVGHELATADARARESHQASRAAAAPLLQVESLGLAGRFEGVDLDVHEGEIVGLSGLVGAGRTEVAESIFGIRVPDSGRVRLAAKELPRGRPDLAVGRGLALITEDRKDSGLFMERSVRDNITAPSLRSLSRGLFVDDAAADRLATEYCRRLEIRTPSIDTVVAQLSGGNQQKVLLAMWLSVNPKVLIVDEPTKGVDVGAKAEIHRLLGSLRDQGVGILLISSDHREISTLADRILVMRKGRLIASLPAGASSEEVVAYASGARRGAVA